MPILARIRCEYPEETGGEETHVVTLILSDDFAPDPDTAHDHIKAAILMGEDFALQSIDDPIPFEFSPDVITEVVTW